MRRTRPVLGVDTSSSRVAFTGDPGQGVIDAPKNLDVDSRRAFLFTETRLFAASLPENTLVAIEEPLLLRKNWNTTMSLVLAAGAVWGAFIDAEIEAIFVPISTWKKTVVGKGDASKAEIAQWCHDDPMWRNYRFMKEER